MANTTVNIDIKVQSKSLQDLENELADINEQLKQVPIGSQAFDDLSKEAQKVTKDLDKATKAAEGFTDDKKFMAADGAIKTLAGSLSGVVGALGVIGVESEVFGDFEKKAASAIAVAIGLKDVSEGFNQIANSGVLASAKAKIFGMTTKQALIATGIGVFVVALGSIVAYWDDITKAVTKFGEKVPFVGKAIDAIKTAFDSIVESVRPVLEFLGILPDEIERANQAAIESNEALVSAGERELALLQAQGATAEEIYNKKREMLEAELDTLRRTEADKEEIYNKETELLVLQAAEEKRLSDERQRRREEQAAKEKEAADAKKAKAEEERLEAEAAERDRLQSIEDIQNEYRMRAEEDAVNSYESQVLLEQERALAELDRLNATEEQKYNVIKYYDGLLQDAREADAEHAKQVAEQTAEEAIAAAIAKKEGEVAVEFAKMDLLAQAANLAQQLAGESKGVQIAAVVAQQAAAIGQIISATGLANAKAVAASPLTLGQPWVTINTISAALSIASAVAAARKSIQDIKSAGQNSGPAGAPGLPSGGGGAPGGTAPGTGVSAPADLTTQAPQTTSVSPAVRAYVLSGDVTSEQEADSKLSTKRTII